MTAKVLATLTAVVGGVSVFYSLSEAAGYGIPATLQDAITGFLGLLLIVAGIWLHPSTPVGEQAPPGP